jgi:hypothetical protein
VKFNLDRLLDYTDEEIIAEIKRVAVLAPDKVLTRRIFDQYSRVAARDRPASIRRVEVRP